MSTTNDNSVITRGFLKAYHDRLKGTIPAAANDGKLTIKVAGTQKTQFSANQSTDATIDITAADLGLGSAMHFKGVLETKPEPSKTDTYDNGDVIIVGNKEYVRYGKTASAAGGWEELGDGSSYALNSVTVTGTGALSGGGNLTENRTITHNTSGVGDSGLASGLYKVTVDKYGHITAGTAVAKADITALGIPSEDTNTWIALVGATASAAGTAGYAPQPKAGDQSKYLKGNGTWSQIAYSEISGTPTIPTVNNGALKVGLNGGTATSLYTANQSTDSTLALASSTNNGKLSVKLGDADAVDVTVYTHPTTAGNKHIPSGGSTGQYLKYSASGTATWASISKSDISDFPTIPAAANDSTITLQYTEQDGTTKTSIDTFTLDQASAKSITVYNEATYDNSTTSDTDLNYIFA